MSKYYEDDDFQDENLFPDTFGDEEALSDEEYVKMMERKDALENKSLALAEFELNQRLLFRAMKFAENYPYWKGTPRKTRLKMIAEIYLTLRNLLEQKE